MIRLFKVYYPVRALVLLAGEALIVWVSFVAGAVLRDADESRLLLNVDGGFAMLLRQGLSRAAWSYPILAVTVIVLLLSYWFDLYDSGSLGSRRDQSFRLFLVLALVAFSLAALDAIYQHVLPGHYFLPGGTWGMAALIFLLFGWRAVYGWLVQQPFLRERVYVLGTGDRAERLVRGLDAGIEVVGWTGNIMGDLTRDEVAADLVRVARERRVDRVIVAMPDRRGNLPVEELLGLRLIGVKVEEATSWLERISGRIEVENLNPSWIVFADGFRFSASFRMVRRFCNFAIAALGLMLAVPLLPFIVLAIKLDSPGPVLYRQKRVGRGGVIFHCLKFRTMRQDAEADTGATWALDDDPRITRVGKFLRAWRLDEIPQLWCVLKGDMHFVGPRPERPEFVDWLSKEIPYYGVRHVVRPGITGWAQVQYKYGNTLDDAREKLQYDLFYIKNASIGLDMLIMFQTIKIVVLGRGAK